MGKGQFPKRNLPVGLYSVVFKDLLTNFGVNFGSSPASLSNGWRPEGLPQEAFNRAPKAMSQLAGGRSFTARDARIRVARVTETKALPGALSEPR